MTMTVRNKKGFTLVEVLVTLLILAFGLMASIVGIMAGVDHVMLNEMRSEAIKIAQEQEEAVRNMDYGTIAQIANSQTISRQIRKANIPYVVTITTTAAGSVVSTKGARLVEFNVSWKFKNTSHSYDLQTIVRQLR
jgi:prepilin-type N-terminal cleavage/methylation domain-containing protein